MDSREIDLVDLVSTVWAGKWLIAVVAVITSVIAITVALLSPDIYRAEALLVPNQETSGGSLEAIASQYGSLASLAGIDVGNDSVDDTRLGLEILQSRQFIAEFIAQHNISVPLLAARSWDPGSRRLEIDDRVYDEDVGEWVRDVSPPRQKEPSSQETYDVFVRDHLSVARDEATGFVTVSIDHLSPDIAKQWVDWLVQDINATVRDQEVERAQRAIRYLEEQIASTSLAELQSVFFRLIEEQMKTVMLANVSPEYLFRTVDPAVVPERRLKPNRALIAVLGAILGLALGVLVVLVRSAVRNAGR